MANEDIGTCPHPFKPGQTAVVRRARRGKFPLYLYVDIAGPVFMKTPEGQEWILDHASLYGPEGSPEPVKEAEPVKEPPAEPKPAKPQKPVKEVEPVKETAAAGWLEEL